LPHQTLKPGYGPGSTQKSNTNAARSKARLLFYVTLRGADIFHENLASSMDRFPNKLELDSSVKL